MRAYAKPATLLFLLIISFLFISLLSPKFLPLTKMSNSQNDAAYRWLHIIPNPNGNLTRPGEFFPTVPTSMSSKDVSLNPDTKTSIRLYLPRKPLTGSPEKFPIVVFVHGGGFILCSAATPVVDEFCSVAATQLCALIVSVDYRLAPEHRLPAAYDDVLDALAWINDGKDEWIKDYGDLSRCVLAGESAGGNIVYHAGLRAASRIDDFHPLIIKGLVLIQPYFGGPEPTASELRLVDDPVVPLNVNNLMWELALPIGANRTHEFCDPTVDGGSRLLDRVRDLRWRVGLIASDGDPLFDRDVELGKLMVQRELSAESMITKDDHHGVFVSDSTNKRKDLIALIKDFLS